MDIQHIFLAIPWSICEFDTRGPYSACGIISNRTRYSGVAHWCATMILSNHKLMSALSTSREIRLAEQLAKACIASQDICAVHHMVFCGLFGSRLHEPMAIAKGLSSNPSILVYIKKWRPEEVVGRETNRQSKWEWSRCNDNDFLRFVGLMVDDLVRDHPQTGTYSNAMKWFVSSLPNSFLYLNFWHGYQVSGGLSGYYPAFITSQNEEDKI